MATGSGQDPPLETCLQQLKSCGIKLNPGMRRFLDRTRFQTEQSRQQRFRSLLLQLASNGDKPESWLCDQLYDLDTECVGFSSAYSDQLQQLTRLTRGKLPLAKLKEILSEDEVLEISFSLDEKEHHWRPMQNGDWFDPRFLSWLAFLLDQRKTGLHYCCLDLQAQNALIGCFTDEEFARLREATGLDWQKVIPRRPESEQLQEQKKPSRKKRRKKPVSPPTPLNYRALWADPYTDEEFVKYLKNRAREDVFRHWRTMDVAACSSSELRLGLEILFAGTHKLDARPFFHRARKLIDRARRSRTNRLRTAGEGALARNSCYLEVLLDRSFNAELLHGASNQFQQECDTNYWDLLTQKLYLAAIRTSLIAGDVNRAAELFRGRKKFKSNVREFIILKALTDALTSSPPKVSEKLKARFRAFFDRIRNPRFCPEALIERVIWQFEYGALWQKYFVSKDRTIDWQKAIEAVTMRA